MAQEPITERVRSAIIKRLGGVSGDKLHQLEARSAVLQEAFDNAPHLFVPQRLMAEMDQETYLQWMRLTGLTSGEWEIVGGAGNLRQDKELEDLRLREVRISRHYYRYDGVCKRIILYTTIFAVGEDPKIAPKDKTGEQKWDEFIKSPRNRGLFGVGKLKNFSDKLLIDGEVFLVFFVDAYTKEVTVRRVYTDEIVDVISNPDDDEDVWYYKRLLARADGRAEEVYYRDWEADPEEIAAWDQEHPDMPVLPPGAKMAGEDNEKTATVMMHVVLADSLDTRGWPLLTTVWPWAWAYREFLQDRANLSKAVNAAPDDWTVQGGSRAVSRVAQVWASTLSAPGNDNVDLNPPPVSGAATIHNQQVSRNRMPLNTGASDARYDSLTMLSQAGVGAGMPPHYLGRPDAMQNRAVSRELLLPLIETWKEHGELVAATLHDMYRLIARVNNIKDEEADVTTSPPVQVEFETFVDKVMQLAEGGMMDDELAIRLLYQRDEFNLDNPEAQAEEFIKKREKEQAEAPALPPGAGDDTGGEHPVDDTSDVSQPPEDNAEMPTVDVSIDEAESMSMIEAAQRILSTGHRASFVEGGPGSGHHDHEGIPGHHGGSLPRGAGKPAAKKAEPKKNTSTSKRKSGPEEGRAATSQGYDNSDTLTQLVGEWRDAKEAARNAIGTARRAARDRVKAIEDEIRTLIEETVTQSRRNEGVGARLTFKGDVELTNRAKRVINDATTWIDVMVPDAIKPEVPVLLVAEEDRASHYSGNIRIPLGQYSSLFHTLDSTLIHEYGHALEESNEWVRLAAVDFYNRRTKGEKEVSLRELTGNKGYASYEMSKPDSFFSPYVGKPVLGRMVGKDLEVWSTEVTSMGLQAMYTNPAQFAIDDREHFDLIINVLRGDESAFAEGGPGSGHFGHRGIPGQQGGSLPSDGDNGADSDGDAVQSPPDEEVLDMQGFIDRHKLGGPEEMSISDPAFSEGLDKARKAFYKAMGDSLGHEMSAEEEKALASYTWLNYSAINDYLRGTGAGSVTDADKNVAGVLKAMTERARLSTAMRLFRGMSGKYLPNVGEKFTDEGLASFSLSRDIARSASDRARSYKTVIEVIAPKGARATPVYGAVDDDELEVIFAPGSSFRVLSKQPEFDWDDDKRPHLRRWVATVEYLGTGEAASESVAAEAEVESGRDDYQDEPKPIDRFCWHEGDIRMVGASAEGGPGSGHFDHKGRPGKVGGSAPGDGKESDSDKAKRLARQIRAGAEAVEPEITALLEEVTAANKGTMAGLEFKLKEVDSIERKILTDSALEGQSLEDAAASITDAVRYTACFEPENYTSGVNAVRAALEERGFYVYDHKGKNYWRGNEYKGINSVFTNDAGMLFELQFHTPKSYETKFNNHKWYEIARSLTASVEAKREASMKMAAAWTNVVIPPQNETLAFRMVEAEMVEATGYEYYVWAVQIPGHPDYQKPIFLYRKAPGIGERWNKDRAEWEEAMSAAIAATGAGGDNSFYQIEGDELDALIEDWGVEV